MNVLAVRRSDPHQARRALRARLLAGLPVTERKLDLAGVSTSVLEGGEGPPVVVLHGPGEFGPRWRRAIPGMVGSHRVIVPDLPGHGESHAGDTELDEPGVIRWLLELIGSTCTEPPTLIGHILGGGIALRFAARHGERIHQVVLVDSLGLAPFRPSLRFALGLLGFMIRPSERSYQRFMGQCEYDRDALIEDMGEEDWELIRDYGLELARDPGVKAAMKALMSGVGVPRIPDDTLANLDVPVALIWGRHDRALPLSIAESASERYGWPLHVIEETADDAPLEQPRAFVRALRLCLEAET